MQEVLRLFRERHARTEIKVRNGERKGAFFKESMAFVGLSRVLIEELSLEVFLEVEKHLAVWVSWVYDVCIKCIWVMFMILLVLLQ